MQSKRPGLLHQKAVLIHNNARLHRMLFIQTLWKVFCGNSSNILHTRWNYGRLYQIVVNLRLN